MNNNLQQRYEKCLAELTRYGQQHVLRFYQQLDENQRQRLLSQIESLDLAGLHELITRYTSDGQPTSIPGKPEPAPYLPYLPPRQWPAKYKRAAQLGEELLREGSVGAFTVAGGQATRLGIDAPKGTFAISPVRRKSLFQLFAESILAARRRYGSRICWYIMTSPANHQQTREFFQQNEYFELPAEEVVFFQQGMMPAFDTNGKLLLAEKDSLALSPDGHGGSLRALHLSGALQHMRERNISQISYFQVDNPLVHVLDPLFIGLHVEAQAEMSSKSIPKAHPFERVGNFCLLNGKINVIEYSDLPEQLAVARNADGSLMFSAASIAIHMIAREFVERLNAGSQSMLPWHRAIKKVPFVDEAGQRHNPTEPNAIKLEMFIFDALPLANRSIILQTSRGEEFSPVKNATGEDSPATCRRDMIRRAAAWLEAAGLAVPRRADGEVDAVLEISPLLALDAEELKRRLRRPPEIRSGAEIYLGSELASD